MILVGGGGVGMGVRMVMVVVAVVMAMLIYDDDAIDGDNDVLTCLMLLL